MERLYIVLQHSFYNNNQQGYTEIVGAWADEDKAYEICQLQCDAAKARFEKEKDEATIDIRYVWTIQTIVKNLRVGNVNDSGTICECHN